MIINTMIFKHKTDSTIWLKHVLLNSLTGLDDFCGRVYHQQLKKIKLNIIIRMKMKWFTMILYCRYLNWILTYGASFPFSIYNTICLGRVQSIIIITLNYQYKSVECVAKRPCGCRKKNTFVQFNEKSHHCFLK